MCSTTNKHTGCRATLVTERNTRNYQHDVVVVADWWPKENRNVKVDMLVAIPVEQSTMDEKTSGGSHHKIMPRAPWFALINTLRKMLNRYV